MATTTRTKKPRLSWQSSGPRAKFSTSKYKRRRWTLHIAFCRHVSCQNLMSHHAKQIPRSWHTWVLTSRANSQVLANLRLIASKQFPRPGKPGS
jgi:hypothetical protein